MAEHSTRPDSRIQQLSVKKLFDRFDYKLRFSSDSKISILTAPNGFGKTAILRIIHNFTNGNFRFFSYLIFREIEIQISGSAGVRITKQGNDKTVEENDASPTPGLLFELTEDWPKDYEPYLYNLKDSQQLYSYLERRLLFQRLGFDKWLDSRAHSVLTTDEVLALYKESIPRNISHPSNLPEWLESLIDRTDSHFIETQRLLSLTVDVDPKHTHRTRRRRSDSVVELDADDLANKIRVVVGRYADETQKLDQTFPRRFIEQRTRPVEDEVAVRMRMSALSKQRDELVRAGLIGESEGEPLSNTDDLSDEEIRRIFTIYMADAEAKLSVFEELHNKVKLFKEILNEHFLFKQIEVNKLDGITAFDEASSNPIRLSELSSGEQHELVLIYDLLFDVDDGSVILIDEPELSLHVGWQRRFVTDILRIQKLRDLQFVFATHSPQIINGRWDLVEELEYTE